jgi:hypothetical protein
LMFCIVSLLLMHDHFSTIEKVNVAGTNFIAALEADIHRDCLPARIGGNYHHPVEPFEFDTAEGGLMWTPPASAGKESACCDGEESKGAGGAEAEASEEDTCR